jgi:hypothetical protein
VSSIRIGGLHGRLELNEPLTPTEVIVLAGRLGIELGPTSFFHTDT